MSNKKTSPIVLVVGGSGYIGSHMVRLLKSKGCVPVIFDIAKPVAKDKGVIFIKGDLRLYKDISQAIAKVKPTVVMMFSGLIVAPESVEKPLEYYDHNVTGAVNLLKAMQEHKVNQLVFSSTAAVYGNASLGLIQESSVLAPINPYGHSKLMVEQIIQDTAAANKQFQFVIFRYFNACGAHPDGDIGENHHPETHLIPRALRTLKGQQPFFTLYGNDYKTPDGTCIRDYIHVMDLCEAHYLAIKYFKKTKNHVFNLGTQKGYSVRKVISAIEQVTGKKVPVKILPRRKGDPSALIASSSKAHKMLGWRASRDLTKIIESAWAWEKTL